MVPKYVKLRKNYMVSKRGPWNSDEDSKIIYAVKNNCYDKNLIAMETGRSPESVNDRRAILDRIEKGLPPHKAKPKSYLLEDVPCKHQAQLYLYSFLKNWKCSFSGLLGTEPNRFLDLIYDFKVLDKRNILKAAENKEKSLLKQKAAVIPYLSKGYKIKINQENIFDFNYCLPIIDLDLTCHWETARYKIREMMDLQKSEIKGKKAFLFSISINFDRKWEKNLEVEKKVQTILDYLKIDSNVYGYNDIDVIDVKNKKIKQNKIFRIETNSDIYSTVEVVWYNDSSPMLSFLIIPKSI